MENNQKDSLKIKDIWNSRKIIWKLSKNDFKKRFAGSYLGKVWAFIQPVVTVLMYWIVFEKLMPSKLEAVSSGIDVPYVVYLTAGLVPWFFFSEGLASGTNALIEYNYLVKKVVFNINILPIIKVLSASFTHIFFAGVLVLLSLICRVPFSIYMLQIIYYSICTFAVSLALIYATSAVVIFFKDLQQIISIGLQLFMWATPIMWNIAVLEDKGILQTIIKLNPICYIVCGYRDAIYGQRWFWENGVYSLYFWGLTIVLFFIGTKIFNKLKVHFADVM